MHQTYNGIYSRTSGLIECDVLQTKRVFVIGLGSFGSTISVELAKAAVGEFAIMDFDKLEVHNVVRHACFLKDVGRFKTDAVADLILGKNPHARIDKFQLNVIDNPALTEQEIKKADIVIIATDNNDSRFFINSLLIKHQKTGIYGRANTRAEGGDVFVQRPNGPCYGCLIGNAAFDVNAEEISNEGSGRRSGRIAAYMSQEDASAVVQVGLAADIAPICNLMVKLALVELSRGANSGISALEKELVYTYWMWANRRERRFANWSPMSKAGNKPTILRWYGAHIRKNKVCSQCGSEIVLDSGINDKHLSAEDTRDININLDV